MTILDTMLAANAEFCAHPPADYTLEDLKKRTPFQSLLVHLCPVYYDFRKMTRKNNYF